MSIRSHLGTGLENTGGLSIKENAGGGNRARMPGISHQRKKNRKRAEKTKGKNKRSAVCAREMCSEQVPNEEMRKTLEEEAVAKKRRRETERKEFQGEEGPRWC